MSPFIMMNGESSLSRSRLSGPQVPSGFVSSLHSISIPNWLPSPMKLLMYWDL